MLTARELSQMASKLYSSGPALFRALQVYRPFICPFEALIPEVPNGATVLDIGCGGGLFLGLLDAAGRRPKGIGFDVSERAIALAQAAMGRKSGLDFRLLDADAPWPEGQFDVVSMIDVLHHVPPGAQERVIRNACAKVRPGGVFLYKDMVERPRWRAAANQLHDLVLARQWIHHVPVSDVERWVVDGGFRIERSKAFNRLWYGHELRVFRSLAPDRIKENGPRKSESR